MDNRILKSDQDLIEKFLSAYNSIEQYLRIELNEGNEKGFKNLIVEYLFKYPRMRILNELRTFVDLRNSLVHGRTKPYQYLAVPLPEVVDTIEKIKEKLVNPEMVLPKFQKQVTKVDFKDPIIDVLKIVHEKNYSKFPVYDNGTFKGLLTENVITQWFASHVNNKSSDIDFKEITVKDLISKEGKINYIFIKRETSIEELINVFSSNLRLEAAFITHTGKSDQGLLGIVTTSDIIELIDE